MSEEIIIAHFFWFFHVFRFFNTIFCLVNKKDDGVNQILDIKQKRTFLNRLNEKQKSRLVG